ncbi:MAG: GntR family transcriptional regulator [Thermomicrobiales bacterium]
MTSRSITQDSAESTPVAPLEFRTKTALVYEQLRRAIVSGQLAPGQRLDQEWLAAELRVSRMPLREALLRLEADGLIQNEPHRSAVVAPLTVAELTDIYAAREAMEAMLAGAGTAHGTGHDFTVMGEAIAEQRAAIAVGDLARFVAADRDFHFTLYRASGYGRAVAITERLRDQADRYIWHYARYQSGAVRSIAEHDDILAACRKRDVGAVGTLTRDHVNEGLQVLRQLVGQP